MLDIVRPAAMEDADPPEDMLRRALLEDYVVDPGTGATTVRATSRQGPLR